MGWGLTIWRFLICACLVLSVSSSSWCLRRAAACDCSFFEFPYYVYPVSCFFFYIHSMCLCHVQSFERQMQIYLGLNFIICRSRIERGGCKGRLTLREIRRLSVLWGLNLTSHSFAHLLAAIPRVFYFPFFGLFMVCVKENWCQRFLFLFLMILIYTSLKVRYLPVFVIRTFVRFVLVWFCRFPRPLDVWEGLRFVIVALPGRFFYLLLHTTPVCAMWIP